jgi:beta-glucanase (GH16 family)
MMRTRLLVIALVISCSSKAQTWQTIIDSSSFANNASFDSKWNYLYPWGSDHNGSARMYRSNITLEKGNVLHIKAHHINSDEGKSDKNPFLPIRYHSGTIHAKHQVTISNDWPVYEVSGSFKAPVVKGSWPAFWLTAVKGWPPETDILEFKGDSINWMNTFHTPSDINTKKIAIADAATNWHHYKTILKKVNDSDIDIYYYLDQQEVAVHRCAFMNKPLWIIINLQMEGSSGGPGPTKDTNYFVKDILVRRSK